MKTATVALYLSVMTILGCRLPGAQESRPNHVPPTVIQPNSVKVSKVVAYFDNHHKQAYVVGTIDNQSEFTISFLDHPEFVRLILYGPDDRLLADGTDGIDFVNPAVTDVRSIPAGESMKVKAWVHLPARSLPIGAKAMLIVQPVSSTDLALELRLRLARDEAVPLAKAVKSSMIALPSRSL